MSSRILVIGGTGTLGQHLVTASLNAGHPTAVLVRPATAADHPGKAKLLEDLKTSGANLVYGDMNDHESLVTALNQADVVISAVGHRGPEELHGQLKIVAAIKEAGNVKRFVPSEYGYDVALAKHMLEPARSILGAKLRVRKALKASGIPHTIICSHWSFGFMLPRLGNPEANGPPDTKATIFGDGKQQAIFVDEKDMSMLTIRAVDDPRTHNKILYMRPPGNSCSPSACLSLGEQNGKTLEKHYVSEKELVEKIQGSPLPLNFQLAMVHWTLVAGACKRSIGASAGVEATQLYPDMEFVTIDECLDGLLI